VTLTQDLDRGTLVVHYRIEAVLGRGGMSVVYLAEDLRLKRRVALKLLAPALAEDQRFRERFLSESELAASLDHANVIPVYEAGETEGRLFIAMRYVEGSDLKALLRDGPLSVEQAVTLAEQVGGALDAAHERGLVHGDVKPSNVLVDGRGHAYLADFGLTKRLTEEPSPEGEAQLMGTIDYVAPEQIRGDDVDGRANIYSLGCLVYECLTGRQPFKRGNDAAVLYAHLEDEPPMTGTAADPVIARALAKTPEERYQTCAEFTAATREALGVAAPRRSRWPLAIAAVAVLIAASSLAAFFVLRGGESSASTLTGRLMRVDGSGVAGTVKTDADPTGVAVGGGRVWLTTRGGSDIWSVDERTLRATRVPWPAAPLGIAIGGGVGDVLGGDGSVARLDLADARLLAGSVQTPGAEVIAGGDAGVWIAGDAEAVRVATVSQQVDRVLAHGSIPQPSPSDEARFRFDVTGIAVGSDAVWVTGDALDRRLFRLDPETGRLAATISLPFAPSSVAASGDAVWVTAQLADAVARVDPATNRIVATIRVGREPMAVAVGRNAVWVANALDRTLSRIDPRTNRVTATVSVGSVPRALAVDGSSVWVAADAR
jgi:YVTN family beta-propeller protein